MILGAARGLHVVFVVVLVAACGHDTPVATSEGDLLAVEQPGPWLTIRHEEVPGLLPAKTTRLLARSPDVAQGFVAGTRVRFGVTQDGNRLVVSHLESLGDAKGPDRTELADQTAHHGGVVATAGELHVEAAASREGTIRVWLDDEDREPVSLAGASGQVELDLPQGRVTRPLVVRNDVLVAEGPPFDGDAVRMRFELRRDGPPVQLYFVLPLTAAGAGVGGVPGPSCTPVAPAQGGARAPRCTLLFPHGVLAAAATHDGTLALISEAEAGVSAWRLPAGDVVRSFEPPPPAEVTVFEGGEPEVGASVIAVRPDGAEAAISIGDRIVRYRVDTGRVVKELPRAPGRVRAIAWSPDGSRLLTSEYDLTDARMLDAETGETQRTIPLTGEAAAVAFRADGWLAAIGSEIGPIVLFDPESNAGPRQLADVLQPVATLGFAGDLLVWAGADRSMRVWRGDDPVATRTDLSEPALQVAVAPDGTMAAVALRGGTVELRRVPDGSLVETLQWHRATLRAVVWAGSVLLSADGGGTVALWDLTDLRG